MVDAYVPVLKGKPGEFKAWRNASTQVQAACRPLFEVVPNRGEARDLSDFLAGVKADWPGHVRLTVDTGYLDQEVAIDASGVRAIVWMAQSLADEGIQALPVFRLDDSADILDDVSAAVDIHGAGACLRLGTEEYDPDPDEADSLLDESLVSANLTPDAIDLVIDMWEVASAREVQRARTVVLATLAWASQHPWRSVAMVSGAFPASISNLPTGTSTAVERFDASLYEAVLAAKPHLIPAYGDYGVANPSMPTPTPRGPLPNLRYMVGHEWAVYREQRQLPGNQSFFTLCQRLTADAHWGGAQHCWGDAEVARCARSQGGAGTATEWRAYGTSHHIASITDRLATLGVP